MALFSGLRAALSAKAPTVAELERAVVEAVKASQRATETAAELRARRRAMLEASDEARAAHKRALAEAEDAAGDAQLYLEALEDRLAEARAAAAEAARRRRYEEAAALSKAATRDLAKQYPDLARGFVALLRQLSEARRAIEAANADLPAGAELLQDPEAVVRDLPALPEQVLKETPVARWCIEHGRMLPAAAKVFEREGRRAKYQIPPTGEGRPTTVDVVLQRYVERTVAQRLSPVQGARLADLVLPGLVAGDPAFWRPRHASFGVGPDAILSTLDDLAKQKSDPRVQTIVCSTDYAEGEPPEEPSAAKDAAPEGRG